MSERKYQKFETNELYTIISLILRFPKSKHKGEAFWNNMKSLFETNFNLFRPASSLRFKAGEILDEVLL